jgi:hypothetical protein
MEPAAPNRLTDRRRGARPAIRLLVSALLGWVCLGVALGLATGITRALQQHLDLDALPVALIQAVIMAVLAISSIVMLRRYLDKRSLGDLGVDRRAAAPLALGLAVGAATGIIIWGAAVALGWIRIDSIDVPTFATFLVINGAVLALYEALPEELALRGHVWTNLKDGFGVAAATIGTTALFPFLGVIVGPVAWLTVTALGAEPATIRIFPAGNDPIVYIIQLTLFGLALVAARRIPIRGALFIAVAFHWAQLTVTRTLFGGTGWADSGWRIDWVEPDAIALVLVHIIFAGALFTTIRWALTRARRSTAAPAPLPTRR